MSAEIPPIKIRLQEMEDRMRDLLADLLALGADLARENWWDDLPAVIAAAEQLRVARRTFGKENQGGRADSTTGQLDPPPTEGGHLARECRHSR